jgi:hypothetical protein
MTAALRDDGGETFALRETTTVGRGVENHLVLQDASVSRDHAQLHCRAGRWFIEDLASRNGTRVNGEPMPFGRARPLRHGDRISLGTVLLTFELLDEPADPDRTGSINLLGTDSGAEISAYQRLVVRCLGEPWLAGNEPATNAEIAAQLGTPLAVDAVKAALRRVYAKTGLSKLPTHTKRRALCSIAQERGWL